MNPIKIEFECPECEWTVDFNFTPGRSAPPCSNHDSPAFSDSDDPAEHDFQFETYPECGHVITEEEIFDQAEKKMPTDDGDY